MFSCVISLAFVAIHSIGEDPEIEMYDRQTERAPVGITIRPDDAPMDDARRAIILNLLARHNIMTLATIRPDGFPQPTIVHCVNDGFTLYFATDRTSQKAGNLALNDSVGRNRQ